MTKEALLPNRCIKCNEPTYERLRRKLTWHHPAVYLTVLVSILVYVVVAMVLRKTAVVNFGLCQEHIEIRQRNIAITWIIGIGAVLCFFLAWFLEDGVILLLGLGFVLATAIYGIVTLRVVAPTKIDDHFVWLKGVSPDFLQEFPQWHGRT